jgi:hypothetical protein
MVDPAAEATAAVVRLVTTVDLDGREPDRSRLSVSARLEAELADGGRVLLLDDRGWGSSGPPGLWATTSADAIADTARMVVGPDEPAPGRTQADARSDHWGQLAGELQRHGASVDADQLQRLPHDVVLSERLRARLRQ